MAIQSGEIKQGSIEHLSLQHTMADIVPPYTWLHLTFSEKVKPFVSLQRTFTVVFNCAVS